MKLSPGICFWGAIFCLLHWEDSEQFCDELLLIFFFPISLPHLFKGRKEDSVERKRGNRLEMWKLQGYLVCICLFIIRFPGQISPDLFWFQGEILVPLHLYQRTAQMLSEDFTIWPVSNSSMLFINGNKNWVYQLSGETFKTNIFDK